jgi:hypothetical protein
MTSEPDWLRTLLAEIFATKWSKDELPEFSALQDAFVFHVADVVEELGRVSSLLGSQEEPDKEHLTSVLRRFFLHAVPHLVAAGQLYDFVPTIFPEQHGVHFLEENGPKDGNGAENRGMSSVENQDSQPIISIPGAT